MPVAVEVYADVVCPFSWVLLGQLLDTRSALGATDVPVLVRAWPFELAEGALPARDLLEEEVAALQASIAPDRFGGFDPARLLDTTVPAMALTSAAYGKSSDSGEAVAVRLRELLFEEGGDVADPTVLGALEAATGLHVTPDPGLVAAEYELALHRGVAGAPHVIAGEISEHCPTFAATRDPSGRLVVTPTPWADDVLRACFGAR